MRSILPPAFLLAVALTLALSPGVGLCGPAILSQDGLPPALTITFKRVPDGSPQPEDLKAQIRSLEALVTVAQASQPRTGWWQNLFASKDTARPVALEDLLRYAGSLKGQKVSVQGLYEPASGGGGKFRAEHGECLVDLAGGAQVEGFRTKSLYGLPVTVEGMVETAGMEPVLRAYTVRPGIGLALLRIARAWELLADYPAALKAYGTAEAAVRRDSRNYAGFARVSAGRIAYRDFRDKAQAGKHYNIAWTTYVTNVPPGAPATWVWMPDAQGKKWVGATVHDAIGADLDSLNSENPWYRFVALFVGICAGNAALGVLLLALVVRLVIWPLTKKQLASGEAMKRLQPQIKELQTRLANDKQKFQQEFWKLCQANKVNPLGGCLPLLIQMPVLMMVYKGIRLYIVQFDKASFLWVHNLAGPDLVLLVLYTLSMIAFQKMTQATNPQASMDPQQQQQQKMMMYMMPLMFFFMFKTFPASFILYWLGTNVIYFLQQWTYTRRVHGVPEVPARGARPGWTASVKRLLSGEPEAAGEGDQAGAAEDPSVDRRSLSDIERDKRAQDRKPPRRGRRR